MWPAACLLEGSDLSGRTQGRGASPAPPPPIAPCPRAVDPSPPLLFARPCPLMKWPRNQYDLSRPNLPNDGERGEIAPMGGHKNTQHPEKEWATQGSQEGGAEPRVRLENGAPYRGSLVLDRGWREGGAERADQWARTSLRPPGRGGGEGIRGNED